MLLGDRGGVCRGVELKMDVAKGCIARLQLRCEDDGVLGPSLRISYRA